MANLVTNSVLRHHAALLHVAGVEAVYFRGNDAIELRIVPGRHRPEQYGSEYEESTSDSSDWLILASDLAFDGVKVQPERGDRIVVDGDSHEVVHQGEIDPWRFTDQTRTVLRVFTVQGVAQ